MIGRSGARVERMGTTRVEISGGEVWMGASVVGGCCCWEEQTRNQKPETRNQSSREGLFWFLVSGFWFIRSVPQRRMRPIRFFQRLHLIAGQRDLHRPQ